jgi:hypothetical protein
MVDVALEKDTHGGNAESDGGEINGNDALSGDDASIDGGGGFDAIDTDSTSGSDAAWDTDVTTGGDIGTADAAVVNNGGSCGGCEKDSDCGSDFACVPLLNSPPSFCVQKCDSDANCTGGLICQQATTAAQKFCVPPTFKCQGCAATGCKTGESCDFTVNPPICTYAGCPVKLVTGECVECTNDTHCSTNSKGTKCISNVCSAANQSNECSVCKDPYPGCVEINGNWSCVECATDADCAAKGKGTCSSKTFTCSATSSGSAPTLGSCKSDTDCPAGTTGFDLACDVGTGLCYDKAGQCDNLAAFCNAAKGSVCLSFDGLGLGGGGGLPQIPGLPGGGGSGPTTPGAGVCSCGSTGSSGGGWDDSVCKALGLSGCDCVKDPASKECDPLGLGSCCQQSGGSGGGNPLSLIACMSALQGSKPDPACFGGKTCLDKSCLTSAVGGGGSTPSVGGGYCADTGP